MTGKVIRNAPERLYAALLLLMLLAAYAGQGVHVLTEDPARFAAHCGVPTPDNGAHAALVYRCVIDNFGFFPFLCAAQSVYACCFGVPGLLLPGSTPCRPFGRVPDVLLRAPPVGPSRDGAG